MNFTMLARQLLKDARLYATIYEAYKKKLENILTERLALDEPEYHLQEVGGRLVGNIISPSFRRKKDHVRQEAIWQALEDELGSQGVRKVGMLLAYSPEEWDPELITKSPKRTRK